MAQKLVAGQTVFVDFTAGEGLGASDFFDYAPNMDTSFQSIITSVNQLVDEMRGVQGPNQTLPLDMLQATGLPDVLLGVASYVPSFISTSQVDVAAGVALVLSSRVSSTSTTSLGPVAGTDDGGTDFAYIALDVNGQVTINTAPGSQALDLWRVQIDSGPLFANNIQRVGTWRHSFDGDAWLALSDASGLGSSDTFPLTVFDEPQHRANRVERFLSGFTTDLQSPAATIGPVVIPGGVAATPGLVLGSGSGTNDLTSGFFRIGADRLGYSTAGVLALEVDATGQLDLPLNFRVKGRRTAAQPLTDASGLVEVVFTAADDFDIGAWHAADADFTVPTGGGGTYVITAAIEWATAITNRRDIRVEIKLGGTLITGGQSSARLEIDEDHASTITVVSVLAAANVVTVEASHDDVDGALGLDIIDATLSIVKVA